MFYETIRSKIIENRAHIVIMGLGYVGLPLAAELAKTGSKVTGFDPDVEKVRRVNEGSSYVDYPSSEVLTYLTKELSFSATSDASVLSEADIVVICVPTPLSKTKEPDLSMVSSAVALIAQHQHPGMLVVLESTSYPGTTREFLVPQLTRGYKLGHDVFVGYSPERIDPGNKKYNLTNTPKIVAGVTPNCAKLTQRLYYSVNEVIVPVTSPEVAEMAKVYENTFRAVNIGLANEVALIARKLGIDPFEVIDAAATKPFGFMPFYPGPGLGGHCLVGSEWVHTSTGVETFDSLVEGLVPVFNEGGVEVFNPDDLHALSFGKNGAVYKRVKHISRRLYTGKLLNIHTEGGQHLTVTEDHDMMIDTSSKVVKRSANKLQIGDYLVLPMGQPQINFPKTLDLIESLPSTTTIRVRPKTRQLKEIRNIRRILKEFVTPDQIQEALRNNILPLLTYLLSPELVELLPRTEILLESGRGPSHSSVPAVIELNEDFARLVGYYLSEGCITEDPKRTKVRFTFNVKELEYLQDVRDILTKADIHYSEHKDKQWAAHHIQVSSRPFGALLKYTLRCGVGCYDASIPEGWLAAPENIREHLLRGLLRGDGSVEYANDFRTYRKNGKTYRHKNNSCVVSYCTVSKTLLQQVVRLLHGLNYTPNIKGDGRNIRLYGEDQLVRLEDLFIGEKLERLIQYRENRNKNMKVKSHTRRSTWATTRVKSITAASAERVPVYSLEVPGPETFVTSFGLLVHNCIPIDPLYLSWKLRSVQGQARFIELADTINSGMPDHVVSVVTEALNERSKSVRGSKILILGVAYKADVSDVRESPVIPLMQKLVRLGADVNYEDPLVPHFEDHELKGESIVPNSYGDYDLVVVAAPHKDFDLDRILIEAHCVVDTRGVYRDKFNKPLRNPKIHRI